MSRSQGTIVPYFCKADKYYGNYKDFITTDFSKDVDDYFSERQADMYGDTQFSISSYIDVLIAPYYVQNVKNDSSFDYNPVLAKHFFELFPVAGNFEEALETNFSHLIESLTLLEQGEPNKGAILKAITLNLATLTVLTAVSEPSKENSYIEVGFKYASMVKALLSHFYEKVELTPANQILYTHHHNNPSKSWPENPLAFFTNLLYGNGLHQIVQKHEQDRLLDDYEEDLELFINRRLLLEANRSLNFIIEKEKFIRAQPKKRAQEEKQEYFNELCRYIDLLYEKAQHHKLAKDTATPQMPFMVLVTGLKKHYETTFDFILNFELEPNETEFFHIHQIKFLKRLLGKSIRDEEGNLKTLCTKETKPMHFQMLVMGDLINMPSIQFQWPKEAVYYLLMKIMTLMKDTQIGAPFTPQKLEACKKLSFSKDHTLFARNNFDQFNYRYTSGSSSQEKADRKRHQKYFDFIDSQI